MLKNAKNYQVVLFVVLNIAINYAGKEVAEYFQWPVWLDTAGTVIAAYVLGPLAGAAVGASVNIIYGFLYHFQIIIMFIWFYWY